MNKNILSVGFVSILLFTGCVNTFSNNKIVTKQEPQWLIDPYVSNDKIAAVGCAKEHINGVEAQKKLAISRAIDQIAIQYKVTVENIAYRQKTMQGINSSSKSQSSSLQTVDSVSVGTKTKAIYTKRNGDICAWVVQR